MPSTQTRFTRFGSAHGSRIRSGSGNNHACGDSDNGLAFKQTKQGYETLDRPPIRGGPTTPSTFPLPMHDCCVYRPQIDPPHPSITTNPVGFVAAVQAIDDLPDHPQACEPISSGFATPAYSGIPFGETPVQTNARPWKLPHSSPPANQPDSDDEEHSTHGVRLILPYTHGEAEDAQRANIDAWLEQVLGTSSEEVDPAHQSCKDNIDAKDMQDMVWPGESALEGFSTDSDPDFACEDRPPSRHSSNKENVPPPLPPRIAPPPYKSSPPTPLNEWSHEYQPTMLPRPTTKAKKFSHPLMHAGYLSVPPRRKKFRISEDVSTPSKSERITSQDYTIRDDDLAAALATLSPSVERHRKGRGPKRERCTSFWDKDILEPNSPAYPTRQLSEATDGNAKPLRNGKRILAETAQDQVTQYEESLLREEEEAVGTTSKP